MNRNYLKKASEIFSNSVPGLLSTIFAYKHQDIGMIYAGISMSIILLILGICSNRESIELKVKFRLDLVSLIFGSFILILTIWKIWFDWQ